MPRKPAATKRAAPKRAAPKEELPDSPLMQAAAEVGALRESTEPVDAPDIAPPAPTPPKDVKAVAEGTIAQAGLVNTNPQGAPVPPVPTAPVGMYPQVASQIEKTGPWGGPFQDNLIVTTPYGDFGCPSGKILYVDLKLQWNKKDGDWEWNPYARHEDAPGYFDERTIPTLDSKGVPYPASKRAELIKKAKAAAGVTD